MILRLQVSVGGIIAPGGYPAAVVFAPAGKLIVRAEVEQEYLGRVKEGARVSVQDENLADGIKRTGSVLSLSKWVAQRRSVLLEPGEINDVRTMECIISIDDPSQLSIGQRMRVRIKR
jgi:multidrug resistance efflux pump